MAIYFEWDPQKERINIRKHGIGFELAQTVFEDPGLVLMQDRMVEGEPRWQAIGMAAGEILLLVAHTVFDGERDEEIIRIISARRADRNERERYRTFDV
ncbi:hypothetical protein SAMN05421819_3765 [Bryocella elongata]|uniref:Uncharacterized protein n=1 Tax=Bryocella elongata TaxID=863522 RepID=A0A1H6BKF2_9BACT|nr:BrnT family toxin [Bryocella elongata]SEG60935.1 hypothetical protein SAMN05421819_3765 [Bryocella elongata]